MIERSFTSSKRGFDIPADPDELATRVLEQHHDLLETAQLLTRYIHTLNGVFYKDVPAKALIVGGFVRDAVIGLHPKDLDLEVYGVPADELEAILTHLFPGRLNLVGKAFGIYKVGIGDGLDLDISIPRKESKQGTGHDGFVVQGDPTMSIREAARRRDFTMNTLCADPLTGEVYDPFGGLEDLRKGILRITDEERFQDDPLRIMRAVQFCARMGLVPDQETFTLLQEMVGHGDLEYLPRERIAEEWKKMLLKAPRPSIGLELMRDLGIIEQDYPELQALIGVPQEPEWHPEGDVWIHTMMVLDQAAKIIRRPEWNFTQEERLQVLFGAVCHDFGKPATTVMEDGRIRSRGHEEAGVEPTREFFARLPISQAVTEAACCIAADHLKPGVFAREYQKGVLDGKQYQNALRRLLKRIGPHRWRVLLAASEADHRGRAIPGVDTHVYGAGVLFAQTIIDHRLDEAAKTPLLQGRDLISLGLSPGKKMGSILKRIEVLRDEGIISSREEAFAFVEGVLEKGGDVGAL